MTAARQAGELWVALPVDHRSMRGVPGVAPEPPPRRPNVSSTNRLSFGLVLSGAGHLLHNIQEFGLGVLAGVETLLPVGITVVLIATVRRQVSRGVLLAAGMWALVVLVAGGGSVLPLSALPFEPEQSTAHYLTHAVYALLQLPLLAATAMAWAGRRHHGGRPRHVDGPERQTTGDQPADCRP
jgi:hypothetical protein